jgi:hypothetical protein
MKLGLSVPDKYLCRFFGSIQARLYRVVLGPVDSVWERFGRTGLPCIELRRFEAGGI